MLRKDTERKTGIRRSVQRLKRNLTHSSKFAVTGFSVALAFEVGPFGIKVTNVAPGMFRASFYDAGKWGTEADKHIDDYDSCRWQPGLVADCQKKQQPGDPTSWLK